MKIVMMSINKIIPYENNPRKNEKAVKPTAESIKQFGWRQPIVVDKNNIIVAGKSRWLAAKKLGLKECPVHIASELTDKQIKAYRIADNRTNEYASWDNDLLKIELKGLEDFNFDFNITLESEGKIDDDEIPEVKDATTKMGELWILGEHRLLCGDSTRKEDVEKLMNNEEYVLLTDPPYNIGFSYSKYKDKKNKEEYENWCQKWFYLIANNAYASIITPGPRNTHIYPLPKDLGIWIKKNATAGASCFHLRRCEPILFYGKFKHKRNDDVFEYSSGFTNELKEAQKNNSVSKNPAPAKPINLWTELLNMFPKDINVLDIFGGNGTTLIACEKMKKTSRLIEIDPHYCDVIVNRWEKFTGGKAKLCPTGKS